MSSPYFNVCIRDMDLLAEGLLLLVPEEEEEEEEEKCMYVYI